MALKVLKQKIEQAVHLKLSDEGKAQAAYFHKYSGCGDNITVEFDQNKKLVFLINTLGLKEFIFSIDSHFKASL